jgi:adenine-specific DNA-methyltransferase
MSKLKMHSPDLTVANIDKLAALFPNCVTESADDKGQLHRAIDFDLLRQELSGAVVEGPVERYTLNWPGKREAIVAANTPVYETLRPCEAESVNFATTKNLYIEGDNLEVLKLLQETYLGKVKMIYIDPPYNTGNDFIYDDDFAEDVEADLLKSSQKDESGGRLVANPESNGRFHSDWLSMMYPRLKLARDLLCEDGVIFISIDDHEVHNLRRICDEVFGERNFLASIIWQKRTSPDMRKVLSEGHEYIVGYCRNSLEHCVFSLPLSEKDKAIYKNPDNDPRGPWVSSDFTAQGYRPNQMYSITTPSGKVYQPPHGTCWKNIESEYRSQLDEGRFWFGKDGCGIPRRKTYISERTSRNLWTWWPNAEVGHTQEATKEQKTLFSASSVFDYPKPVKLLKRLVTISTQTNDLVLDFFSGSATTADAVMQLNAEDGGNRRFIMVQLPEVCDEKSEAFKAGYKNICEIGKERIRRAGQKIKEANATNAPNLDVGFRVFKVDSSNMKGVYYTPDATEQAALDLFADAIKEDRTAEDLLFQVFLTCGLDLALPVSKETIADKTVFAVDQNVLVACFAADIPESLIRTLAQRKPLKAVFLDRSFAKDSTKLNVTQIFKQLSPGTEVMTL